ncbi:hypothetical protein GPN2_12068 [Streptomyces murinus]
MRGDHARRRSSSAGVMGPPPHARGPHPGGIRDRQGQGTTPACAGTTGWWCGAGACCRDHPRMRGDHTLGTSLSGAVRGPPPHARGPPILDHLPLIPPGTTPACAGTTVMGFHTMPVLRDHPRMRGDHSS